MIPQQISDGILSSNTFQDNWVNHAVQLPDGYDHTIAHYAEHYE
jgi:hypothetical protein